MSDVTAGVVKRAEKAAFTMGHHSANTEHLLLALWLVNGNASRLLQHLGIHDELELVVRIIERHPQEGHITDAFGVLYDPVLKDTYVLADQMASECGSRLTDSHHLLAGIAMRYLQGWPPCIALEVLDTYGIKPDFLVSMIRSLRPATA